MPELPEVETIRRGLEKYIVGQEIVDVEILSQKQFTGDSKLVIGAEITGVRRFGKGLVIDLSNGFSIAIHAKMTGRLIFDVGPGGRFFRPTASFASLSPGARREALTPVTHLYRNNKHTHVIFKLKYKNAKSSDSYLYYNDIRKFGWIRIVETKKVVDLPFFKNLGPEPSFAQTSPRLRPASKATEGQASLTVGKFQNILVSSKAPIKSVLMDQHKISGIGNIYANEALFLAKIHPTRRASSLTQAEAKRLLEAIEKVLRMSIEAGGSSMTNYVNALGEKGTYQEHFLVYKKEGERCPACKSIIEKIKIAGRGTFYCNKCQKSDSFGEISCDIISA
jgi:formamidopyrimidine-DNA glycosylase